jgi:septal ring factor EnvC (AmiA/AmiB activator)
MAEVTNEMIYELLKQVQEKVAGLEEELRETRAALSAIRMHMIAMQQDIQNIYATLTRHEARLDRIERRLGLVDAAT